jgi:hypothetical protein
MVVRYPSPPLQLVYDQANRASSREKFPLTRVDVAREPPLDRISGLQQRHLHHTVELYLDIEARIERDHLPAPDL